MAKVFLDTNIVIDLVEERGQITPGELNDHDIFISPLSVHILMYITKHKVPYSKLRDTINSFILIPFDENITHHALSGPTSDFEDNVQLHSCAEAACDYFLTADKKIVDMKFFGKTYIASQMESSY